MCRNFLILFIGFILHISAEEIGSSCNNGDAPGTCVLIENCPKALENIKINTSPAKCGSNKNESITCCINPETVGKNPSKVGEISQAKCWEYGESVYHISETEKKKLNESTCSIEQSVLVPGVKEAEEEEFPHMALLGFEETENTRSWMCVGTLISNQFVLTVAHCVFSRHFGSVKWIRLGELSIPRKTDASPNEFSVIEKIVHPSYKPPSRYNDIALLKMDRSPEFSKHIRPACLHTSFDIPQSKYIETAWGLIGDQCKASNDTLKKVVLEAFTQDQCNTSYPISRHLKNGITPESQMCAGNVDSAAYTCRPCRGTSGAPLQIYHPKVHCMYSIVGVLSFGKHCENFGSPDVYNRVSNYIEWIEKTVWPQG